MPVRRDCRPFPLDGLKNLEYVGIEPQPIKLIDGAYESAARVTVRLADELVGSGDLDGDGKADAAVLLTKSSGGSGELTYLAIVVQADGQLKNTATLLIGDRVQVRSLVLSLGGVTMETIVAGPKEPACCPTTKMLKILRLVGTELRELPSQAQGKLSIRDLEGTTWRLVRLGLGAQPVAGRSATVVFQGERVSGSGGCNRYFSRIKEAGPGDISFGPVGATQMACPESLMTLEHDFLHKLEKVRKFGFHMGKLVLTYEENGSPDGMQFVSEP